MPMSQEAIDLTLSRWRKAREDRDQWMIHWDDLAWLLLPRRAGFVTTRIAGERRTEQIFDGTPMRAARGLANSVSQLLRPEGEKWFFIRAVDDALNNSDEALDWMKMAEDKTLSAIYNPKARFRQAAGEADADIVVFGTAVMFTGEGRVGKNLLRYNTVDLKDATVLLNDEGQVDTLFQYREYTLRQAIQKFGLESLSRQTQQTYMNDSTGIENLDSKYEFLRLIEPRGIGTPDAIFSQNLPFKDVWIEINQKHIVSEGGFHEFPFAVPRWDTSSGEIYGRGPGMIALPDSETLNAMSETILVSGQKAADPPILAPNDSSFDAFNSFSGGITYYDVDTAVQTRGNPFFTLQQDFNLPITRDMQQDYREQVEAAFFRNIFNLPVNGPEMTATEVLTRKEEFIREIGPVFGRLESDYSAPVVERSFSILLRNGAFNPIPEALQGTGIRFEYTSPFNKIREQAQVAAARLWLAELAEMAAIDQRQTANVMDNADLDSLARFSARALDLPLGVLVPQEVVTQDREQKEEMAREQLERDKVGQEAAILESGSKAVSNITGAMAPAAAETPAE